MRRSPLALLVLIFGSTAAAQAPVDSAYLAAWRWRSIGPDRGGRSIAVSGVRGQRNVAYFGATGGGLWKTIDGGHTWRPVTDGQIRSASVGAVAVSETSPDIVYIGMGESCIRGNIMPGDGVYRSTDAGRTWQHVGFRESDAISKIRIHPTNPQIVFVASFGRYSTPSEERGVYKSTDGGRTWRRVLFRNASTGAVDIAIDRTNPQVVYAALWEAYRKEYQMSSGGPGSGLFKSTDGGETWTEITRAAGMPAGLIGRIGVDVSGANGNRVYALVENEQGGLFVSDDAGSSWRLVNANRAIRQRAFYYTHVFADPKNVDVVYMQNTSLFRSTDGGRTTRTIDANTHGDHHDLWIDPDDPAHLVDGNDGGGAISTNTGGRWTEQDFPTAQWYHVITTKHIPYHVCGSQQDNTTLCVPFNWNVGRFNAPGADTADITAGAMQVSYQAGGGEPGYIAPDPLDPDVFYAGTNNGRYLDKYNRRLGTGREVNPYPWFYSGEPALEIRERWQWTFPIIFSPVDPRMLFVSSQRLWKTTDGARTWKAISGDLTRREPATLGRTGGPITGDMNGPEVYATIFAVGPSKLDTNIIWTGSDDGLVHVTRNSGRSWTNVTPAEMPEFGRVSQIDASAFEAGRAYVSVRRPLLGDVAPYIFRTTDFGRTWTKIVNGIRADAYVHAVREDPVVRGLLYAATQHGVYISWDDGAHWQSLSLNLPDVPVADLVVEKNELVIGTHGRGFWVLDNIAPLRQANARVLASDVHLFTPPAAVRSGPGVVLSWRVASLPAAVRLEILDSTGAVLRTFAPDTFRVDSLRPGMSKADSLRVDSVRTRVAQLRRFAGTPLPRRAGVNHLLWDLRAQPVIGFPGMILWGARLDGPAVPPGRYTVRLTADGQVRTAAMTVSRNPRIADVSAADLRAQYAFSRKVRDRANDANRAVVEIRQLAAGLRARAATDSSVAPLLSRLAAIEERIYQVRNQSGQDPLNFPIRVNNRLVNLLSMAERGDGPPNRSMEEIFTILSGELGGYLAELAVVRTEIQRRFPTTE